MAHPGDGSLPSVVKKKPKKKLPSSQTTKTKMKNSLLKSSCSSISAEDLANDKNSKPKKKIKKNSLVGSENPNEDSTSSFNASNLKKKALVKKKPASQTKTKTKTKVPLPLKKHKTVSQTGSVIQTGRVSPASTSISSNSSTSKAPVKKQAAKGKATSPKKSPVLSEDETKQLGRIHENNDCPKKASTGRQSPKPTTGAVINSPNSPPRRKSLSPKCGPKQTIPKPVINSPIKKRPLSPMRKSMQHRSNGNLNSSSGAPAPLSPSRQSFRTKRQSFDNARSTSMKNLQSPTNTQKQSATHSSYIKKPISSRMLPSRTRSADLDELVSVQRRKPSPDKRRVPRSRSGDLELLTESSMHERTGIQTPPSILRNSSHHAAAIARKYPTARARFHGNASSDDNDHVIDELFGDDSSMSEESIRFDDDPPPAKPTSARPGLGPRGGRPGMQSRSKSSQSFSGNFAMSMSTRSLMSQDKQQDFPDDKWWQKVLRYIRILPPRPDEKLEKKRIRQYLWTTLFLDFIAALVSITTYNGVTTCCGVPIFSLSFISFNWSKAIRITTYVYLVMIFAEIIPVVRRGLPFNLLNPMVGFTITFAMFFDDRITEAICMWLIEAAAICFEFLVFRCQRKLYHDRYDRLDTVEEKLNPYISSRKLNSPQSRRGLSNSHSKRLVLSNSSHNGEVLSLDGSDEDSMSGHSFGDDDEENPMENSMELPSSSNHKLRKVRLLRERRILRQRQKDERRQLNFHLGGVVINFGLICISFLLIVVIASSGGLCVRSDVRPVIFDMNQLDKCGDCRGQIVDGRCEICSDDGLMQQCYYQYI